MGAVKTSKNLLQDEEVINQYLRTQDNRFLTLIYDRYADKVFRKCISLVKSEALAEDLMHDIMIKVFANLAQFKATAKFSTWIYSVTYNYCIDYLRKSKKRLTKQLDDNFDEKEDIQEMEDQELLNLEISRLKVVIEDLAIEEKSILLMKYQDDLSIKDIQSMWNLSESAVKMRLKRAKDKVRKLYNEKHKNG